MSSHGRDVIFTLDGLFQRHDSSALIGIDLSSKGFFLSKSQRYNYMNTIVDVIIQPNMRDLTDYSRLIGIVFERLFKLCSDDSNDIRIYSEDCLSKLITNLRNTDVPRIIRQLQLELKRNSAPRRLRSALRRYAHLSKDINPIFLRSFIQEFVPLLLDISNRDEEFLLEDFKDSFLMMSPFISSLFLPCNIQDLIQNWLHFLTSSSTVKRRVGANLLTSLVANCTCSIRYISRLLQLILGLVPEGQGNVYTLLGVICCLRSLFPLISSRIIEGHFSSSSEHHTSNYSKEILDEIEFNYILQATVLVSHSTTHPNHNVVNAALDALAEIFNSAIPQLIYWLLDGTKIILFQPILDSIRSEDASFMDLNLQQSITNFDLIEDTIHLESELLQMNTEVSIHTFENIDTSALVKPDPESDTTTESTDSLVPFDRTSLVEDSLFEPILEQSNSQHEFGLDDSRIPDLSSSCYSCILDDDVHALLNAFTSEFDLMPITRIIRRICRNLLPGIPGSVLPSQSSVISIQNSSIKCLTTGICLQPDLIFLDLFPSISSHCLLTTQSISDVFFMFSSSDPSTLERTCILAASFIKHYLIKGFSCSIESERNFLSIFPHLLNTFVRILKSPDGMAVRASCLAMKYCLPELLQSCYCSLVVQAIYEYFNVRFHSFWLVRVELCNLLSVINWNSLAMLETTSLGHSSIKAYSIQNRLFSQVFPSLMNDEEPRVRDSVQQLVVSVLSSLDTRKYSLNFTHSNLHSFTFLSFNQLNFFHTTLEVVITVLSDVIVNHESKSHFLSASQVLSHVAKHYKPQDFPLQWCLFIRKMDELDSKSAKVSSLGLLHYLFNRIYSTLVMNNCLTLSNVLFLVISLFKGSYFLATKANDKVAVSDIQSSNFLDKEHLTIGSDLFQLIMRILRIFHVVVSRKSFDTLRKRFKSFGIAKDSSIIEETHSITSKKQSHIARGTTSSLYYEKKGDLMGKFSHVPNCMRLLQLLKTAYLGYQRSTHQVLDDRFRNLFQCVLESFIDFLSCPVTLDLCLYTEEILLYLSSAIQILPCVSLLVIEKFVTVLYHSNYSKQSDFHFEDYRFTKLFSLHEDLYSIPLNTLNRELSDASDLEQKSFREGIHVPRQDSGIFASKYKRSTQIMKSQKARKFDIFKKSSSVLGKRIHIDSNQFSFKNQIKYFEGILTYSLNIFSYSANDVQNNIISLLSRLMCFQLNYSLIDPNFLFLNKIISQVDYIEKGLISDTPGYISTMFLFLVLISAVKPDILPFSKVILLSESVIASSKCKSKDSFHAVKSLYNYTYPETYCIEEDVDHLFSNFLSLRKDLVSSEHGHRDILLNLLIRLIEYSESTHLLANIVLSTQRQTNHWIDNSLLIVGPWLQKMKRLQIHLDTPCEFESMQRLLFCLHPSSLNNVSLLFLCLSSSKEIDILKFLLRWIAGALLIFKLSFRCKNEIELFLQLKNFIVSIPSIAIAHCLEINGQQIGLDLSPQQFLTSIIFHTLFMSTQLLENILKFTMIREEPSFATSFLYYLISQILTLILWILKDYTFKSMALSIRSFLLRFSLEYIHDEASKENFFFILLRLKNRYPLLFLQCISFYCIETETPVIFWDRLIKIIPIQTTKYQYLFQHLIFSSIVIDIIHQITLHGTVYFSLLNSINFIHTISTYRNEYWIVRFLDFLKSSPECSNVLAFQLTSLFKHTSSLFKLKDYLFILEYLHISSLNQLFTSISDFQFVLGHETMSDSSMRHTMRCCDVIFPITSLHEDRLLQNALKLFDSNCLVPYNLDYIFNFADLLCSQPSPDGSMENHECMISTVLSCMRNPSYQWYFDRFTQVLMPYSIFSVDHLFPLRSFSKQSLGLILSLPTINFDVLQFIVEYSYSKIIENDDHLHLREHYISKDDSFDGNDSYFLLLKSCSLSFISYISENSDILNLHLIFKATRCLVSIFDGITVFPDVLNDIVVNPHFLLRFGFLLLQNTICLSNPLSKIDWLIPALLCPSYILEVPQVRSILRDFKIVLQAAVTSFFKFIILILGESFVNRFKFSLSSQLEVIERLNVLLNLLPTHLTERYFPSCLIFPIRSLLISICHSDLFYNSLIIPLSLFDDIHQFEHMIESSSFPQVPLSLLHETDRFSDMMKRIATLGWKTKDQFEEIWSLLIKVLVPSDISEQDYYNEEIIELMKNCCIAIEGITTHLMTYFICPTPGIRHPSYGLDIHCFGDSSVRWLQSCNGIMATLCSSEDQTFLHTKPGQKISDLRRIIEMAFIHSMPYRTSLNFSYNLERVKMFRRNIERSMDYAGYLTVQFLKPPLLEQRSTYSSNYVEDLIVNADEMPTRRFFDVNLTSCIRLLSDLYNVWLSDYPNQVSLMLFHTILKSMFVLSDLFTEESQYDLMLQTCLKLYNDHSECDVISNIYIFLAILKSASICEKDSYDTDRVMDVLEAGLLSKHTSITLCTLEGILFLLKVKNSNIFSSVIPSLTVVILRALAESQDTSFGLHQRYILVVLSAGLSLIQFHFGLDQQFLSQFVSHLINYCNLHSYCCNWNVLLNIFQTFERLILGFSLHQTDRMAIMKLTLTVLNNNMSFGVIISSLSLLLVCMYSGEEGDFSIGINKLDNLTELEVDPMTHNIDLISQTRDRIFLLLRIIRQYSLYDARYIAEILVHMLLDLLPSNQSMNILIGEFLHEDQCNKQLIGWIMFKLFQMLYTRGQDNEVKIWGLLCINSFAQSRPIRYSIWNLSCLFISISKNIYICNLFPFVLSRVGKLTSWDIEVFLSAAVSFYDILEHDERRQFNKEIYQLCALHPVFSCLTKLS